MSEGEASAFAIRESSWPQRLNWDDCFELILLSFYFGSYFFLGTLLIYLPGGITEQDEFRIFVQGWVTVPVFTLLAMAWFIRLKRTIFHGDPGLFTVLLGFNALFWGLAIIGLYLIWNLNYSRLVLQESIIAGLIAYPVFQLFILRRQAIRDRKHSAPNIFGLEGASSWLIVAGPGVLLFMASGIFARYQGYNLSPVLWLLAVPFGLVAYLHKYLMLAASRKGGLMLDLGAMIVIVLACFDPLFSINSYHENFYLGPINALLHGKTMLVDVYSQYGVFLQIFLAMFFKLNLLPLNYQGLAFLIAILSVLQYAIIYYLCRILVKSPKFSVMILLVILLLNLFATLGYFQSYPSVGPVRFGLCYVLITLIVLRLKFPARKSLFTWLEYGVLGVSSIWSIETFLYISTIFFGMRVYESIVTANSFVEILKSAAPVILKSVLAISLFQVILALDIVFEKGVRPNWIYYFELVYLYSVSGFGTLSIDVWSPWLIIVATYFVALIYPFAGWMTSGEWDTTPETQVMLSLAFFGIAQFTYYLGRSHPNNLFHICVPAILVIGYGASQLTLFGEGRNQPARNSCLFAFYASMVLVGITFAPRFNQKFSNTGFGFISSLFESAVESRTLAASTFREAIDRVWHPKPTSSEVAETIALIRQYAQDKSQVVIFFPNDGKGMIETLFLSHKAQVYPITEPVQDALSANISNFIVSYPPNLQPGDAIFLPTKPESLLGSQSQFQIMAVWGLCRKFGVEKIAATQSGLAAFRLGLHGGDASTYCEQTQSIINKVKLITDTPT